MWGGRGRGVARDRLATVLGHRCGDPALLDQGVTHPSATSPARPDNQRLEFLGDRVLGLVVAEALLAAYPGEAEGPLAPPFNPLVRRETLAAIAPALGPCRFLRPGPPEAPGGRRPNPALPAPAAPPRRGEPRRAALHGYGNRCGRLQPARRNDRGSVWPGRHP